MSYKIGFDGVVTAELDKMLQSIEKQVNGFGMHAQTSDTAATAAPSGSTTSPCTVDKPCPDSVKGPHPYIVVVVIAIVVGTAAGHMAGKRAAKRVLESVKGPHV